MNNCLSHAQLESVLQSKGKFDPELATHLEHCPRCSAKVKMLRAFLDGPSHLDPHERAQASEKLREFLDQTAHTAPKKPKRDFERAAKQANSSPRFRPARSRIAIWAMGTAAILAIGIGIGQQMDDSNNILPSGTLRGTQDNVASQGLQPSMSWNASGLLEIGLDSIEEGLEYEIEFLDDGLSVISSVEAEGGSSRVIAASELPPNALMIRIRAMRQGKLVQRTPPIFIPIR